VRSLWVSRIKQRQRGGTNIAAVALANKNARVLWALLSRNEVTDQLRRSDNRQPL
jgi:transposase